MSEPRELTAEELAQTSWPEWTMVQGPDGPDPDVDEYKGHCFRCETQTGNLSRTAAVAWVNEHWDDPDPNASTEEENAK
jgi:hypothetical protein